jgi:hypothetical protein
MEIDDTSCWDGVIIGIGWVGISRGMKIVYKRGYQKG